MASRILADSDCGRTAAAMNPTREEQEEEEKFPELSLVQQTTFSS